MSKWYDMKSMPIGDQRNIVVEVRGAPQSQALAYWTGRIWAFAPISDKPVDIGFNPVEYRMPIDEVAAPRDLQLRDDIARQIFTAGLESAMKAADYSLAVKRLANRAYLAADAMLDARK